MPLNNVIQIKDKDTQKALDSLNRITGLTWDSIPVSLVPKGLVINAEKQTAYALERKRA
ncbi:hypothetical protein [Alkalimarinus sediminis]|uniref:Uncharacterized protein n=1 Tax=Alkalimarinus sediminis TaxID=1632866 RepID=A0A9E8KJM9_9ALTE|nr:hypothetical protein [Alkalimarinus sediminis]UZW75216.1 hypothetical protein NNL22_00995 [Alkalimarinus sediminis]